MYIFANNGTNKVAQVWKKNTTKTRKRIHNLKTVGDQSKAMCRYCKMEICAHHGNLLQHANTDKHKKNSKPFSSTRLTDISFTVSYPSTINQKAELQLASYIACHTAVSSVDHLGELVNSAFKKDLSIHRTKYTALINNVIAPCMFKDLLKDIGETPSIHW